MRRWCSVALLVCAACSSPPSSSPDGGGDARISERWAVKAPLARGPRQETGVAALGGRLYVVGGFNDRNEIVSSVEVYDPGTDAWTGAAPLPRPLHHANVAVSAGKLYVLGALTGGGFTAVGDTLEYDPQTDQWTAKAPMPAGTERGGGAVAEIDGRLYVAGGFRSGSVADFSVYDPAADSWTTLPDLPEPRDHLNGAAQGQVFLAIGGRKDGALRARVDAFDVAASTWSSRAPMPTARAGAAGGRVGGLVVIVGGEGNRAAANGVFPQTELYDPAADQWTNAPQMLTPRHGMGAAAIGGTLYVPGGATREGFGAVATHEAFTP